MKRLLFYLLVLIAFVAGGFYVNAELTVNDKFSIGDPVDSLNGVIVYYNGDVENVSGRNLAPDGYNLGLKYQCVEFVKRYYYQHLDHKMPDSYGHAKDFFNPALKDVVENEQRALLQFTNGSTSKPEPNDLIVFGPTRWNQYGHVAIISEVMQDQIEIIQQNPGKRGSSRAVFDLKFADGKWTVDERNVLGWLRKQ